MEKGLSSNSGAAGSSSDFVNKLYKMLEDPTYRHIVRWSDTGDSFVVLDNTEFTKNVLPRHFKHSNFASFVRQLNKYDFHKIRNTDEEGGAYGHQAWEFKHPNFLLHNRDQLENIKRKAPAQRKQPRDNDENVASHDAIDQLQQLRAQLQQFAEAHRVMDGQLENNNTTCQALLTQVQQLHRKLTEYEDVIQNLLVSLSRQISENKELEQRLLEQKTMRMNVNSMAMDEQESSSSSSNQNPVQMNGYSLTKCTEFSNKDDDMNEDGANRAIEKPLSLYLGDSMDVTTWKLSPFDPGSEVDDQSVRVFFAEQTPELSGDTSSGQCRSASVDLQLSSIFVGDSSFNSLSWKLPHPANVPQSQPTAAGMAERPATPTSPIILPPILGGELNQENELPALSDILDKLMGPACLWDSRIIMPRHQNFASFTKWSNAIIQSPSGIVTFKDQKRLYSLAKGKQYLRHAVDSPRQTANTVDFPIRILIVDDDASCRKLLSHILSSLGLEADFAPDGMAALELASRLRYSVIFMDSIMPKLDGISTARLLRRFDKTTPIIYMMSNQANQSDANMWKRAGITAMLPKPFGYKKFYSMMYKYLPKSVAQALPRNLHIIQQLQSNPGLNHLNRSLNSDSGDASPERHGRKTNKSSVVLDRSVGSREDGDHTDFGPSAFGEGSEDVRADVDNNGEDKRLVVEDKNRIPNTDAIGAGDVYPTQEQVNNSILHDMTSNQPCQSSKAPAATCGAESATEELGIRFLGQGKRHPGFPSPRPAVMIAGDAIDRSEPLVALKGEVLSYGEMIQKHGLDAKSPNTFTLSPASSSTSQHLPDDSDFYISKPETFYNIQSPQITAPYPNQANQGRITPNIITPSVSDDGDYNEHQLSTDMMDIDEI